jgi:hypothetical protein
LSNEGGHFRDQRCWVHMSGDLTMENGRSWDGMA